MHRWASTQTWWLTQQPARVQRYFAGATALAVVLTVAALVTSAPPDRGSALGVLVFAALAVGTSVATRSVMVAFPGDVAIQDIGGVWMVAALLLWGPWEALALALVVGGLWTQFVDRHWGGSHRHLAQQVLNVAAMAAAVDAAALVMHAMGQQRFALTQVVGVLVYLAANATLVFGVVHLATGQPWASALDTWSTRVMLLTEATLSIGIYAAWLTEPVAGVLLSGTLVAASAGLHYAHLLEEASTDQRTGLLRPDTWTATVERIVAREPVAVILADLDHFKDVNDRFGHLVGDEVLTSIGATIAAELRPGDIAGRWGGEEFVVALPGLSESGAREVAERLVSAVRHSPYGVSTSAVRCTMSAGVAVVTSIPVVEARNAVRLVLRQADTAMYAAKRAGRNRVVAYADLARDSGSSANASMTTPPAAWSALVDLREGQSSAPPDPRSGPDSSGWRG